MSWLNDRLERPLRRAQASARYRPAIDAVLAAQRDGVKADAIATVALGATRDEYIRSKRPLDPEDMRYDAYLAASAAALERPYQLADVPEGPDKAQHYFVCGTLSAWVDSVLDKVRVPRLVRRGLGVGLGVTLGFFKEVADIFTSGFSREDLLADWRGANSPFRQPG